MYEGGWDINEENETVTSCHALKLQMDAFSAKSLLFRKKVRIFAAAEKMYKYDKRRYTETKG